jgi:glutamate dehydrogenase/leucine dehydrogenase
VIASYFEWLRHMDGNSELARNPTGRLAERIEQAYGQVAARAEKDAVPLRVAAYVIALERVAEAGGQTPA